MAPDGSVPQADRLAPICLDINFELSGVHRAIHARLCSVRAHDSKNHHIHYYLLIASSWGTPMPTWVRESSKW